MTLRPRLWLTASTLCAALAFDGAARAAPAAPAAPAATAAPPAPASDPAKAPARHAEELYDEALTLIDAGRYTDACPKLEESERLDAALGTEFNLADCDEHVGKLAMAFRLFAAVERGARTAGKEKLETSSRERVTALEPRIGRLRLEFQSEEPDARVRIDGARIEGEPMVLDPGPHVVEVVAPGKRPWSASFAAVAGQLVALGVPALAESKPSGVVAPAQGSSALRIAGVSVAGAGVVAIGIGGIFGLTALSRRNIARTACGDPDPARCGDPAAVGKWHEAKTAGDVSTVAFVSGAGLLATGAVLWFLGVPPKRAPAIGAAASPSGVRIELGGAF